MFAKEGLHLSDLDAFWQASQGVYSCDLVIKHNPCGAGQFPSYVSVLLATIQTHFFKYFMQIRAVYGTKFSELETIALENM